MAAVPTVVTVVVTVVIVATTSAQADGVQAQAATAWSHSSLVLKNVLPGRHLYTSG